jgi:long-chain fatty acid transport protein
MRAPELILPALIASLAAVSVPASAAFFQIAEQSASGIGNAFAGGAAVAEDASTVWYNPAGMTRLDRAQLVVGGSYIRPSFTANVLSASTVGGTAPIGGGGGDAGVNAFVPNLYATYSVSRRFTLGAAVNAPFGLVTAYDNSWAGRYYALRSDIKTVNINLAAAFKVHDALSVGLGANHQNLQAELTQAVDFVSICTAAAIGIGVNCANAGNFGHPNNPNDGHAKVTAKGDAWGYNAGILSQLGATRVGLAYRSQMKYKLDGSFDITAPPNVPPALLTDPLFRLVDSGASTEVTLPSTLSLSAVLETKGPWAFMGDVTRTNWSALPELRIKFDSGQKDQVVTFNLKDVYRYSIGATYRASDSWLLRVGVALDRSPVPSPSERTPRLPDSDRRWLSLGAGLRASERVYFDFAYTYIRLADSSVQKTDGGLTNENTFRGNLSANYTGSVQIFSAQVRWTF